MIGIRPIGDIARSPVDSRHGLVSRAVAISGVGLAAIVGGVMTPPVFASSSVPVATAEAGTNTTREAKAAPQSEQILGGVALTAPGEIDVFQPNQSVDVAAELTASEAARSRRHPVKCETMYLGLTKVRYAASEYKTIRRKISNGRPKGWSKEKYQEVRNMPLSPNESCKDREELYDLNNFEARLRKEHPKEILKVLGMQHGWTEDEVGMVAAIVESGRGVPSNKAENASWNPCRKQGQPASVTCATSIRSGHQYTDLGYGIGQATPGRKMSKYGKDWAINPIVQVRWLIGYVEGRHGSPAAALSYKIRYGHF